MTRLAKLGLGVLALAAVLLLGAPKAHAVVIFYSYGEEAFESGPLPPELAEEPELKGAVAGYRCHIFGLFWAYFHSWDCHPVAFRRDGADTITWWGAPSNPEVSEAIKKQYPASSWKAKLNFWEKNGRLVVGGGLLLFIVGGALARRKKKE